MSTPPAKHMTNAMGDVASQRRRSERRCRMPRHHGRGRRGTRARNITRNRTITLPPRTGDCQPARGHRQRHRPYAARSCAHTRRRGTPRGVVCGVCRRRQGAGGGGSGAWRAAGGAPAGECAGGLALRAPDTRSGLGGDSLAAAACRDTAVTHETPLFLIRRRLGGDSLAAAAAPGGSTCMHLTVLCMYVCMHACMYIDTNMLIYTHTKTHTLTHSLTQKHTHTWWIHRRIARISLASRTQTPTRWRLQRLQWLRTAPRLAPCRCIARA